MTNPADSLPTPARELYLRGQAAQAAGDAATALQAFQQANQLAPDQEPILAALGALAMAVQDWAAGEQIHRHLNTLFPGRHLARLALAIFNQQRHSDALPILEEMANSGRIDLNCALAYATCLERCGEVDRAITIMISIYRAAPTSSMAVLLTSAFLRLGRRAELDQWLPTVLADHPGHDQLLAARSEHAFLSGDYGTGFDFMSHRWSIAQEQPKCVQLACPVWDGTPFAGTLLVTAEQGLGDEILSSSMFEELVRIGQPALIDCDRRLLPVFRRSFPALAFCDRHGPELLDRSRQPGCRKIEGLELGRYFRRDITGMPRRASWLLADPERVAHWRHWLDQTCPGKITVGLSWRSHRHLLGSAKTIPLPDLAPLIRDPRLACIRLQYSNIDADLAALAQQYPDARLLQAPGLDPTQDIDGLFAMIAALDTVVTSSNTTAHIAGALGVPTRVMLPGSRYVLWYWGHDGEQAPWYPALQLFRGPPRMSWPALAGVVAEVVARHGKHPPLPVFSATAQQQEQP